MEIRGIPASQGIAIGKVYRYEHVELEYDSFYTGSHEVEMLRLERALENGAECRAILQQIAAVRGASNGLMAEVLESHIRETFDQNDSYSHEVSKSVDDTIELVRAYLK